ncbi:MAG: hypothetical protein AAF675_15470 [Pseudomonadota bacterium]
MEEKRTAAGLTKRDGIRIVFRIMGVLLILVILGWIIGPFFNFMLISGVLGALVYLPIAVIRRRLGRRELLGGLPLAMAVVYGLYLAAYTAPMRCLEPNGAPYRLVLSGPVFDPKGPRENSITADERGDISISISIDTTRAQVAEATVVSVDGFTGRYGKDRALAPDATLLLPLNANLAATALPVGGREISVDGVPVFTVDGEDVVPAGVFWGSVEVGPSTSIEEAPFRMARPRLGDTDDRSLRSRPRWRITDWRETIFENHRPDAQALNWRAVRERCLPAWMASIF